MGFDRKRSIFIWVILSLFSSSFSQIPGWHESHDPESLAVFLNDYANKTLQKPRTGIIYNISLPSNLSGIEISYVRLRSGSFWSRGANSSSILIPPRVIPMPYVKRLAIVYYNLGNWSSYFYEVPGYSFVAPVVGFMAYDSSNSSTIGKQKLEFSIMGDPISVLFPKIELGGRNVTPRCVKFSSNGSFEFSNMSKPNLCVANDQGHFSVVVPLPLPNQPKTKSVLLWRWWVLGFGSVLIGLVLLVSIVMAALRLIRRKSLGEMERESEKGVAFDNIWIGSSKMPSASMIRTQPALENDHVTC